MEVFEGEIKNFILSSRFDEKEEMVRLNGNKLFILQYSDEGIVEKERILDEETRVRLIEKMSFCSKELICAPHFWRDERCTIYVETTTGKTYYFTHIIADMEDISNQIREILKEKDLLLFDGNPSYIEILKLAYWERNKDLEKTLEEELLIDRKEKVIKLSGKTKDGKSYSQEHKVPRELAILLGNLEEERISSFDKRDEIENKNYKNFYNLEILDSHGREIKQSGAYYEDNLPCDFGSFCEELKEIIESNIFAFALEKNYAREYRKPNEDTLVKVKFSCGEKLYTYLADNEVYEVSDKVVVPVGKDNRFQIGTIMEIVFDEKENVPFPIENLKKVVRKYDSLVDVATIYSPKSWMEKNKDAKSEDELCEAYQGAFNEEKNLRKYLEDPMHAMESDIHLPQWTNLKNSYEKKLLELHPDMTIIEIMLSNEFETDETSEFWIEKVYLCG